MNKRKTKPDEYIKKIEYVIAPNVLDALNFNKKSILLSNPISGEKFQINNKKIEKKVIDTKAFFTSKIVKNNNNESIKNGKSKGEESAENSNQVDENPDEKGNIRDFASIEQLVVLSNLERINAVLIHQELPQSERLIQLNKVAINQMKSLTESKAIKKLK